MGPWKLLVSTLTVVDHIFVDMELQSPCCSTLFSRNGARRTAEPIECLTCHKTYAVAESHLRFLWNHDNEESKRGVEAWLVDLGGMDPLSAVLTTEKLLELGRTQTRQRGISHTELVLAQSMAF